jgi:hypothetical protein
MSLGGQVQQHWELCSWREHRNFSIYRNPFLDFLHESLVTQKPLIPDVIILGLVTCGFPLGDKFLIRADQTGTLRRINDLISNTECNSILLSRSARGYEISA